ncbi:ATP-binding protein, partial [Streptomyces sp. NPDC057445]|uniref:ATP-binding protein n=1 Tax=Streptomyces sp. NPDC057445 TaxID=3346136 RepID=UPI00368E4EED
MATAQTRFVDLSDALSLGAVRQVALTFFTEASRLLERPLRPQLKDAVLLVVSELVSNARRHSPGPCTLRLSANASELGIDVTDTNPRLPRGRAPDRAGVGGGWGWGVITALTHEVHVVPGPGGGKTV